jgi:hypothetical protein
MEGTRTSSPGATPIACTASWMAAVPCDTAIAWATPMYRANSCSKALTSGPRMNLPESTTSSIACFISGVTVTRERGITRGLAYGGTLRVSSSALTPSPLPGERGRAFRGGSAPG